MNDPTTTSSTSYPLATTINFRFSAYEDRLILTPRFKGGSPLQLLMTRRMLLITLQQCLKHLPDLAGLNQTPSHYWQEVLQLNHQSALQQAQASKHSEAEKTTSDQPTMESDHPSKPETATDSEVSQAELKPTLEPTQAAQSTTARLYLVTEILAQPQLEQKRINLGFKGLKLPEAMTHPQPHQPLVGLSLTVDNLHQLIHQLVTQAQTAQWHLPLDLPWLNTTPPEQSRHTSQ